MKRSAELAFPAAAHFATNSFKNVETFWFKKQHLRLLSNFADVPVTLHGISYPTGEHCFHAEKYKHAAKRCNSQRAKELCRHADRFKTGGDVGEEGIAAKRAGGKGKTGLALSEVELQGWQTVAETLQLEICRQKVMKSNVSESLLETGNAYLLHQDNRAHAGTPWGGKIPDLKKKLEAGTPIIDADVIGQNRLGKIWMLVRDEQCERHRASAKKP